MTEQTIFGPVLAMLLLTLLVWVYMYARRLHYFSASRIDPQSFATRAQALGAGPPAIQNPANNFSNLLELPLIFYVVCFYLYSVQQVDAFYMGCAWAFVALRAVHSLIQCTFNRVVLRFAAYALAAVCLWTMVIRAAAGYFSAG